MERNSKTVLMLLKEGHDADEIVDILLPYERPYEDLTEEESRIRNRKVIKRYVESVYARFIVAPMVTPVIDKTLSDEFIDRVWTKYKNTLYTWSRKRCPSMLRLATFISNYSQYEIRIIKGTMMKEPKALRDFKKHGIKVHAWGLLRKEPYDNGVFVYAVEEVSPSPESDPWHWRPSS